MSKEEAAIIKAVRNAGWVLGMTVGRMVAIRNRALNYEIHAKTIKAAINNAWSVQRLHNAVADGRAQRTPAIG